MTNKRALVVFSGGQDSTTCLGYALSKYSTVRTLTFNYGQRHRAEVFAAQRVIEFFESKIKRAIPRDFITLPNVFKGRSPLTNPDEPLETYKSAEQMAEVIGDRVEKTFIPMRNAVFLMIAANAAICHDIYTLVTGVCQEDNANYPDCRQSFIDSAESTINKALGLPKGKFQIETPLMDHSKASIVRLALKTPHTYDALAYSHTAYDGRYPPTSMDHASVLRADGFLKAGVPDPLVLRAWREGLMELPSTENYNATRQMEEAS